MVEPPRDVNGVVVRVGSKVRLLRLEKDFIESLPSDEIEDVSSMIGEVFEVYDIDEYGQPWIMKEWRIAEDQTMSHSLALSSNEMEAV